MSAEILLRPVAEAQLAKAIAEDDIGTLAKLADAGSVAATLARKAKAGEEAQREWSSFSLRAQRACGEALARMPKAVGGRPVTGDSASSVPLLRDVLEVDSQAVATQKAKRYQDVAAVPEDVFEEYLERVVEPTRGDLLRVGRIEAARRRRDALPIPQALPDELDIRVGDFRVCLDDVRDIDAIVTDPPYPREFLPLLEDLATFADEHLTPDGVLAVMLGELYLPDAYRLLSVGRRYRWTMCYLTPGPGDIVHAARVMSRWKPVLVYGGGPRFEDTVTSPTPDKSQHMWGQSLGGTQELVSRLTEPGQLVCDPFLGGGTTAVAARNIGRRFVGCDVDPYAIETTLRRLGESFEDVS